MSPMLRREPFDGDHGRARELAALRLDEHLAPGDEAWLDAHLAACGDCRAVADAYDEQRVLLRALRDVQPVPPRDLWARTAAAMESDDRGRRRAGRPWRLGPLPLAPVAAVLVVAIAVGAGLLNGIGLPTSGPTTGAGSPGPTPIALTAGDVQVLSRTVDGTLELSTRPIHEVCPLGAETCGTSAATDNTPLSTLGDLGNVDAIISPTQDRIVVLQRGSGASGVYVLTVGESTRPSSSVPPSTPAPATPTAPASPPVSPTPTISPTPEATPTASASPGASVPATSPETSPSPPGSPGPTASPAASPTATPEASPTPAVPTPTVEVTPAPNGALEIAHDVILVGTVSAYSADGSSFAFTARPADGSAGPDVYVWRTTDATARAVTGDHASLFASWFGDRLLISRIVDGSPTTRLLNPDTGDETAVGTKAMWRPAVAPDRRTAVWWDGTVAPAGDGFTWRPADGRLVLGPWPRGGADAQSLSNGPVRDWQVRWNESGTALGVWTSNGEPGTAGRLSLYLVDAKTGAVAKPLLDKAPAFEGFSLRDGRLAWSAPAADGETTVQVLAWLGDKVGQLQLTTTDGGTVIR